MMMMVVVVVVVVQACRRHRQYGRRVVAAGPRAGCEFGHALCLCQWEVARARTRARRD